MIDLDMRDIDNFFTFEWGYIYMFWFRCIYLGCGPSVWVVSGI